MTSFPLAIAVGLVGMFCPMMVIVSPNLDSLGTETATSNPPLPLFASNSVGEAPMDPPDTVALAPATPPLLKEAQTGTPADTGSPYSVLPLTVKSAVVVSGGMIDWLDGKIMIRWAASSAAPLLYGRGKEGRRRGQSLTRPTGRRQTSSKRASSLSFSDRSNPPD